MVELEPLAALEEQVTVSATRTNRRLEDTPTRVEVLDREVVVFSGQLLVLRWIDPEIGGRYGTGVYVRCTGRS